MSPVLNTMLPIGNALASMPASLPVQALSATKTFELAIPTIAIPTPTAPAPAQIAPGKMLNIEGSAPADTAIPADVIPARAIELLNASVMREDVPAAMPAKAGLSHAPLVETAQPEKPRWAFERYLPVERAPVDRVAPLPPVKAEPEGSVGIAVVIASDAKAPAEVKGTVAVAVDIATETPIETAPGAPIKAPPKGKTKADAQPEPKAADPLIIVATENIIPQAVPAVQVPNPVIVTRSAPASPNAVTAPKVASTPVARPSLTVGANSPEPIVTPAARDAAMPAEIAETLEAPVQHGITDPKNLPAAAPAAKPVVVPATEVPAIATPAVAISIPVKSAEPVTVVANSVTPESRLALTRPVSTKASQAPKAPADAYAFVTVSHKAEIEAPIRTTRSVAEPILDSAEPVAIDADVQIAAATPLLPLDTRVSEPALAQIDGVKTANPLAELSGASHVAQRHLDLARDTQWLDGLARDIVAASDRSGNMSFRLSPANLGQLDVALANSEAGLSVTMTTNSEEATQIVTSAQPALVDTLQSQGVRVADTQVMSQADLSRQGQPQRQAQTTSFIETGFSGSSEPDTQDSKQPRGRFA